MGEQYSFSYAIKLPEQPDYVSGDSCGQDGLQDRGNPTNMIKRFIELVRSDEFKNPGWQVAVRTYAADKAATEGEKVPGESQTGKVQTPAIGYHTLELIKPDGSTFASLSTLHIERGTGEILDRESNGGYAATFIDDCVAGNEILIPENMKAETVLLTGKGSDALLTFAKAVKCAKDVSSADFDYSARPDWQQYQVNHNTLTRAYAEAATGKDSIVEQILKNGKDAGVESPGLDIDLLDNNAGRYSIYDNSDEFITDPYVMKEFYDDLVVLHPNVLQGRAIASGIINKMLEPPTEQDAPAPGDTKMAI